MDKFYNKKEYRTGLIVGFLLLIFVLGIYLAKNVIWRQSMKNQEVEVALGSDGNFTGKVELNEGNRLVIRKYDANQQVFSVDDDTWWRIHNEQNNNYDKSEREKIVVGDDVWVAAKEGETGLWTATTVNKELVQKIAGKVISNVNGVIKIEDFMGKNYDITGSGIVVVEKPTGRVLTLEDIKTDTNISATGKFDSTWSKFETSKIEVVLE